MTTIAASPSPLAGNRPLPLHRPHARNRILRGVAVVTRWLHIYLSLFGFATILFFAVTGVTLNHPDWFGLDEPRTVTEAGELSPGWVVEAVAPEEMDKLQIVELLRSRHGVKGALAEFRVDDYECVVGFKGPAYAADALIDRATGRYELTVTSHGTVALLNDLHKGRDTGRGWSLVIDVSAVLMAVSAATGLVLLLYIRRKRLAGLTTAVIGTVLLIGAYWALVP